ncbi:MAG: alpha/beta fold hydrolase [Pararobbsia sp.]
MIRMTSLLAAAGLCAWTALAPAKAVAAAAVPEQAADFTERDFHFADGTTLPDIRIHYVTLGTPQRNAHGEITNAVLLMHGTTGTGAAFLAPAMRRELFAAGEPLDASRYFIVIPDGLGRGGSSKPSDGLRAKFPHYGYGDVVEANHRLLVEGLHIDHLRLVLGTSMGGMQTWMWGERYPQMADALMPIASQPIGMAGRNWLWRQMIVAAIRNDPGWQGGDYAVRPTQWTRVMPDLHADDQQSGTHAGAGARPRSGDAALRHARGRCAEERSQRRAVLVRVVMGLQPGACPGADSRTAVRGQFRRRPDQCGGPRRHAARDRGCAERPFRRSPGDGALVRTPDARPSGSVETVSGSVTQRRRLNGPTRGPGGGRPGRVGRCDA